MKWLPGARYCNLIDSAVGCPDSRERLAHVAAFAVSCYASSQHRTLKPLNPLLGETFEYLLRMYAYAILHTSKFQKRFLLQKKSSLARNSNRDSEFPAMKVPIHIKRVVTYL